MGYPENDYCWILELVSRKCALGNMGLLLAFSIETVIDTHLVRYCYLSALSAIFC